MLGGDALRAELGKQLSRLNLDGEKRDKLVRELDYLSSIIVDLYLARGQNGQREETDSQQSKL